MLAIFLYSNVTLSSQSSALYDKQKVICSNEEVLVWYADEHIFDECRAVTKYYGSLRECTVHFVFDETYRVMLPLTYMLLVFFWVIIQLLFLYSDFKKWIWFIGYILSTLYLGLTFAWISNQLANCILEEFSAFGMNNYCFLPMDSLDRRWWAPLLDPLNGCDPRIQKQSIFGFQFIAIPLLQTEQLQKLLSQYQQQFCFVELFLLASQSVSFFLFSYVLRRSE